MTTASRIAEAPFSGNRDEAYPRAANVFPATRCSGMISGGPARPRRTARRRILLIYVVLGMHKSGTTLVSQMLHHGGIFMGENLDEGISYDRGNKYEDDIPYRLNLEFLHAPDDQVLYLEPPGNLAADSAQRERMRAYIDDRNRRGGDWGFKDPRTCLTYPLWEGELGKHRIIAVYRPPEEGWPRFRGQGLRDKWKDPIAAWAFLSRWCEHNGNILEILERTTMDHILLGYHDLMTGDAELERLRRFVGRPLEDRRRKDLYRSRPRTYRLLEWTKKRLRSVGRYDADTILERLRSFRTNT